MAFYFMHADWRIPMKPISGILEMVVAWILTAALRLINGGMVYTYEGCSSICDSNGDLLFYSDGLTVWTEPPGDVKWNRPYR